MHLAKPDRLAVFCAVASLSLLAATCEQPTERIETAPPEPSPFPRHVVGQFVRAMAGRDKDALAGLLSAYTQLSYVSAPGEGEDGGCAEHGLALSELLAKLRVPLDPNDAAIVETPLRDEVKVTLSWPRQAESRQRGILTLVYWRSAGGGWELKNVRVKEVVSGPQ